MKKKLSKLQAYNVMLKFLETYYWKNKSNDLSNIISFSQFCSNKTTADSAMWLDWQNAIILTAQEDKTLRNQNKLTCIQAFNAMFNYLKKYFSYFTTMPIEIDNLLKKLQILKNKQTIHDSIWQEWLRITDDIIKKNDPRIYLEIGLPQQ